MLGLWPGGEELLGKKHRPPHFGLPIADFGFQGVFLNPHSTMVCNPKHSFPFGNGMLGSFFVSIPQSEFRIPQWKGPLSAISEGHFEASPFVKGIR